MKKNTFSYFLSFSIVLILGGILDFTCGAQGMHEESEEKEHRISIFAGYDTRAPIGYYVFEESVLTHTSQPIAITPLCLSTLKKSFTREKAPDQLTDFSYSRFMAPYYSGYKGWSIYLDGSDMMVRDDIVKLWNLKDDRYAVMVVKHPEFKEKHSFLGKEIPAYPMLNWSSVILFNNEKCERLTSQYVNTASYYDLHQFKWLDSETQIGTLPDTWNHLVGYYKPRPDAALIHWTLGAPYGGREFAKVEHAEEWFDYRTKLLGGEFGK